MTVSTNTIPAYAQARTPNTSRMRLDATGARGRWLDPRPVPVRASRILRDFLAHNADKDRFTVQHIVKSLEPSGPAASLMLFSVPAIARVPGTSDLVGAPTMAMSSALIGNSPTLRLPKAILERSVPRRALALAIHAVLPVLERAERLTKKRWSWLCTPTAQRAIGVLVFLLALPLAFPILGFGLPHATSLFTISLGMIENDGLTIALGVTAGIASLVFLTGKSLTPKALALKAADWIKNVVSTMTSVGQAAVSILRYACQWLSVKLLSGRNAAKGRPAGRAKRSAAIPYRPAAVPSTTIARDPCGAALATA